MIAEALHILKQSICKQGILASTQKVDNYNRVWSRDSMMAGIVGLLHQDEEIIAAHKNSILTLAHHQLPTGQIPSNVSTDETGFQTASYGTLVGRVDATTWWLIGAQAYCVLHPKDKSFFETIEKNITSAFHILTCWEINNRGLIYTPLGGNWADEYIIEGYTLYDNCLRLWALQLSEKLNPSNKDIQFKTQQTRELLRSNFTTIDTESIKYHTTAFEKYKASNTPYYPAALNANGYQTYWDMSGNAIAMMLQINTDKNFGVSFLEELSDQFSHCQFPVFFPVLTQGDWGYQLLENNFNYQFKNKPFHFHNGGSWPIFSGWLCMGLSMNNNQTMARKILNGFENNFLSSKDPFQEYINPATLQQGGTSELCYSASGYLLMKASQSASHLQIFQSIIS
jgi:hypothetical protein